MARLQTQAPSRELRPFVRAFAERATGPDELGLSQPVPARLEQTLEFQLGNPFQVTAADGDRFFTPRVSIVGSVIQGGTSVILEKDVRTFAIFFQPTGFSQLFGFPNNIVARTYCEASCLLGHGVTDLHERLAAQPTFAERVALAEKLLQEQLSRNIYVNCFASASNEMFLRKGVVRVTELASMYGTSERHFLRQFRRDIGICPKLFARVARFQTALDVKISHPQTTWLEIAHSLGYHDQMHLVRDFHTLAGGSPGQIFESIGDSRPHASLAECQY
jgi:AraC-like DNA-binding protein